MKIFKSESFKEMMQSTFADPKSKRVDLINVDVSSNSRLIESLKEFQAIAPHKYVIIEKMMKMLVTLTEGHWASYKISFWDLFFFMVFIYQSMLSQYLSRLYGQEYPYSCKLIHFMSWIMFFLTFWWGINRYIISLVKAFEDYKEKEIAVMKKWNKEYGKWQYIRQKPSVAYKYIEIHIGHGKECVYCTACRENELKDEECGDTGGSYSCDSSRLLTIE